MIVRALLAFLALPGLVAFLVPFLIAWPRVREGSFNALALILLIPGIALLLWCVRDFLVIGKGTLAPWDPPRSLVSSGPYRFSRNPIYLGFVCLLAGFPLIFRMYWGLILCPLLILSMNALVIQHEEAYLEKKFGDVYTSYKSRVRRWL